jgi:hypothetical protein
MTHTTLTDVLYKVRAGGVQFVDVPEFGFAVDAGRGDPNGPEFADAVQALFAVSYGAHFLAKRRLGTAGRVMPLEALWWVDGPHAEDVVRGLVEGRLNLAESDRDSWRWQAMILQPEPADESIVRETIERAPKKAGPALSRVGFERWQEGHCAQLLHVGPYAAEGAVPHETPSGDRCGGLPVARAAPRDLPR